MRKYQHLMFGLILGGSLLGLPGVVRASGCYICQSGSAAACKDYCAYSGADTFDSRRRCEAHGCKIGGTAACPAPSPAVRVCQRAGASAPIAAAACAPSPRS